MSLYEKSPVTATRGCQYLIKSRLALSEKTLKFLKLKTESIQYRYRDILSRLIKNRQMLNESLKTTFISLSEVKFVTGNINQFVLEKVNSANVKVYTTYENIVGIKVPNFKIQFEGADSFEFIGLARGGQQV